MAAALPMTEATGRRMVELLERICELLEEKVEPELPHEEPPRSLLPKYGRRPKKESGQ